MQTTSEEETPTQLKALWQHLDLARPAYTDVKPILTIHSIHKRTYTLPNSELHIVSKPLEDEYDEGLCVHITLISGAFRKSWMLHNYDPPQRRIVPLFWRAKKYMLVLETVAGLTDVKAALAHDVAGDAVDLILQPANPITTPKFRLIIEIPANPSLLATVTFFERFWLTPTDRPVVKRRNAKHFASAATLARFVMMKRV